MKTKAFAKKNIKSFATLLLIFWIGAVLRFTGLNWDQGHHLHPDERFLNMLVNDISLPESWSGYLDPARSPLNPRNHGRDFYVYGNWPITLSKLANELTNAEGLGEVALVGRALSAAADSATIILVYFLALVIQQKLKKNKKTILPQSTAHWAALTYALIVLPIQQAHFFTTDAFLAMFLTCSMLTAFTHLFSDNSFNPNRIILSAICFGMALGSKITALLFLPLILLALFVKELPSLRQSAPSTVIKIFSTLSIFMFVSYLTVRLTSPYLFASANFLNPAPAPELVSNLQQLKSFEGSDVWFPPAIQWINRPATFGLTNMAFFGMGLGSFLFLCCGVFLLFKTLLQKKLLLALLQSPLEKNGHPQLILIATLVWTLSFIIYYSLQFVTSVRYFYPIYPILSVFGGVGVSLILQSFKNSAMRTLATSLTLLAISLWPLMFINIYLQPHSRIQASHWIYQNIPTSSLLLSEHWDDALPLHLPNYQHRYQVEQLPVFGADTPEKWQEMEEMFTQADYYILSSNRAWGSITRVPEKYPQMSQFYEDLFADKTQYQLIAKFSVYPSLEYLGIPISFNDNWAEEAFSVYDHPEVYVFKIKSYTID